MVLIGLRSFPPYGVDVVVSFLFSNKDFPAYKVPSKYKGNFSQVLYKKGRERETPTHNEPNMAHHNKQVQNLKFLSSHNDLAFEILYFRLDQQSYMLGVSQIHQVQAHSLFSTANYLTLFLDKGWCTYRKQLALPSYFIVH